MMMLMRLIYSVCYCHLNHIPPSLLNTVGWWRKKSEETQLQIQWGDFQRVWDREVCFWCCSWMGSTIHVMYISHNICFFYSNVEPKKRHPIEEQENEETPQEKKLRLAKLYIDQLKEEGEFLLYVEIFFIFTQYTHQYWWCKITFLRGTESRWRGIWKRFDCWETSRRSGKGLSFNATDVV